jgi:toxin ParE1/3/4
MYQLQILRQAREDMQKAVTWYNERQEGLGEQFLSEVIKTLRKVEVSPLHYEEKFAKQFRFAPTHIFPYLVVFKIKGDSVIINAVFHTSRDPKRFR